MPNIIPIQKFCELENKTIRQARHLMTIHKGLKAKVKGERSPRINMDKWEKILKSA